MSVITRILVLDFQGSWQQRNPGRGICFLPPGKNPLFTPTLISERFCLFTSALTGITAEQEVRPLQLFWSVLALPDQDAPDYAPTGSCIAEPIGMAIKAKT